MFATAVSGVAGGVNAEEYTSAETERKSATYPWNGFVALYPKVVNAVIPVADVRPAPVVTPFKYNV